MRYATHFCSMTSWQVVDWQESPWYRRCDKLPTAIQDRGTVPVGRSGGPLGICPDRCSSHSSHTTKSQCKRAHKGEDVATMQLDLSPCLWTGWPETQKPKSHHFHKTLQWLQPLLRLNIGMGISSCASKPACSTWHVNRFAQKVTSGTIWATLCQRPRNSPIRKTCS